MDTTMRLIENSHQGFEGIKAAVCLGSRRVKSNDASGLRRSLRRNGVRNRCQTGLDYFGARYMSAPLGRFMSPDPLMASANTADPQSWNRYVYGRNNPLRYNDPMGLFPSPAYYCEDDSDACLNDEQRRILENSKIEIGKGKGPLSGEALWNAIGEMDKGEARQNAFVNITDKLASLGQLSDISSLTGVNPDRIFANVSGSLESSISASSDYMSVRGHGGDFNGNSYKNIEGVLGNIQFSFSPDRTRADIDLDIGNAANGLLGAAIHAGEFLWNDIITFGRAQTNQDVMRRILIHNPKIMITPSTAPAWNRSK